MHSNDSMLLSPGPGPRDRICSSDDDYVLMNGVPSPVGTLPRHSSTLNEEETVIRRNKLVFNPSFTYISIVTRFCASGLIFANVFSYINEIFSGHI